MLIQQQGSTTAPGYLLGVGSAPCSAVPLGTITVLAAMAEITSVTAPKPGHLASIFFLSLSLSLLHPSNTCSPEGLSPCGLRLRWMLLYIYIK